MKNINENKQYNFSLVNNPNHFDLKLVNIKSKK